jgi:WhiB family redox-sensing transcriptional regulator
MYEPASTKGQPDWRSLSACRQEDPELFFPDPHGPGLTQLEIARAVCARCQVRAECLSFAMETIQDHGVWGGTSEEERRVQRRARLHQALRAGPGGQERQQRGRPVRARFAARASSARTAGC